MKTLKQILEGFDEIKTIPRDELEGMAACSMGALSTSRKEYHKMTPDDIWNMIKKLLHRNERK